MDFTEDQQKCFEIFFGPYWQRVAQAKSANQKFAHYTSAEAAMSIIENREVWLRNCACMNDYTEIDHGFECLFDAYHGEPGSKLGAALELVRPGCFEELGEEFDKWLPSLRRETFMVCVSEHDISEDQLGRLSMWRAYGGNAGVAFVFENNRFFVADDTLKAYTYPVSYWGKEDVAEEMTRIAAGIKANVELFSKFDTDMIFRGIFGVFRTSVFSLKHQGFKEEREWRVVYTPSYERSKFLKKAIVSVRGAPQQIYKLPLENDPDQGLVGISIPDLLDRIIIGPAQFPTATYDAFCSLLKDAGIGDPKNHISFSSIPLR
jgi:hypothetical protein